jgi:hypothetical protein
MKRPEVRWYREGVGLQRDKYQPRHSFYTVCAGACLDRNFPRLSDHPGVGEIPVTEAFDVQDLEVADSALGPRRVIHAGNME